MKRLLLFGLLLFGAAHARDGSTAAAGKFDYYLLSLSWSPEYCATTQRNDELQCARPYAFVAHGLWPQNERGYPADCPSRERVSEATIDRLLPIMPSRGLIIHEWRKHGTCSGLNADAYFGVVEQAYRAVRIPERYRQLPKALSIPAAELRRDLLSANPTLKTDGLKMQCSGRYLQEVRICLDRSLAPRVCGSDLRENCGSTVTLRPLR